MSLTVVEAREQLIVTALNTPMTMEELRDHIGCNIYTLRKSMATLQDRGIVVPTGHVKNRKPTYAVASNRPIPELYRKSTGEYISPIHMQINYAAQPNRKPPVMLAGRYLYDATDELLSLVANPDLTTAELTTELERIRADVKVAYSLLNDFADMCQQLLSNPAWWSPSKLRTMQSDPEFDADSVFERHSQIISGRDQ